MTFTPSSTCFVPCPGGIPVVSRVHHLSAALGDGDHGSETGLARRGPVDLVDHGGRKSKLWSFTMTILTNIVFLLFIKFPDAIFFPYFSGQFPETSDLTIVGFLCQEIAQAALTHSVAENKQELDKQAMGVTGPPAKAM